ncbi:MAG: hypothetical protein HYY77_04185, partial [Betaproteobacteria bacterium]|nr:hypothetical protein [Betaproteobacteria bacterium]
MTDTRPISVALKPLSTQNGLTMKPIDVSASLKIRMKISTGTMPGRLSSSSSAPNIGPCSASGMAGAARGGATERVTASKPNTVSASAHAAGQKYGWCSDQRVTLSTSHRQPSANASTAPSAG